MGDEDGVKGASGIGGDDGARSGIDGRGVGAGGWGRGGLFVGFRGGFRWGFMGYRKGGIGGIGEISGLGLGLWGVAWTLLSLTLMFSTCIGKFVLLLI